MFTGIVTDVGVVERIARGEGLARWSVRSRYDPQSVAIGASIAHAGCCLTVVEADAAPAGMVHVVELAAETLAVTSLGRIGEGGRVNLERSLKLGDELGGHMMSGHVDGLGAVRSIAQDGAGYRLWIDAPAALLPLIAPKGSIAVDGVSLTVNAVDAQGFGVMIIPHTWAVTTLGALQPGDAVNLEADLIARYVARLAAFNVKD